MNRNRIASLLLGAGITILFWDVVVKLVSDWATDDNYSHGFLVVPLAGLVVWRLRGRLAATPVRPSYAGLVLVIVSLLTLLAGRLGIELFLTRIALIGTLAGAVWFVWGAGHLKALRFPFLLLFLAVPIPAIVFNQITFPLQLLASRFGELTIAACRIPVLREGNVIILATTSLEVVEACSGIRSLVSLLTLAVVWGYLTDSPTWLRWLLAASSVPIAIFANGIRVAGTGVASHFIGPKAAEGFLHTFSGWMVFVVAGILMLAVHRLGSRLGPAPSAPSQDEPRGGADLAPTALPQTAAAAGVTSRSLAVALVLVIATATVSALARTEAVGLRTPLSTLSLKVGIWDGQNLPAFDARLLDALKVDEYVSRVYVAQNQPWVSLYVGYYSTQRRGQTVHSPLNCLPGAGWHPVERGRARVSAPLIGSREARSVEVNRLIIEKGLDRQLVLYWYQSHGRVVASEYWGKIYTVIDAIRFNRSDVALVRVIVPITARDQGAAEAADRAGMDFVRALLPGLSTHLDG